MNEKRWLAANDLEGMLQFLRIQPLLPLRLVDRKLMYWMAEALRKYRTADAGVDLILAFADGRLTVKQLRRHDDFYLLPGCVSRWLHTNVPLAAQHLAQELGRGARVVRRGWDHQNRRWVDDSEAVNEWAPQERWLIALLREYFGNPWAVASPDWLHFHGGVVRRLAEEIELDAAWDLMPILGDALEDAGCAQADVLDHCRADVQHRKGCWVLDLIRPES